MDFRDGKQIVESLEIGVRTGVPARFDPRDLPDIENLIRARMVESAAFTEDPGRGYRTQNLAERTPVTALGRQMFG